MRAKKLTQLLCALPEGQLRDLHDLVAGRAALLRGSILRRELLGWRVNSHLVHDGGCTCEDFRFRNHECKHMKLVRCFLDSFAT